MKQIEFELRGEHIALDALLKATGLAGSGGEAKQMIVGGAVLVDGQTELRRSRKVRGGQIVQTGGTSIQVSPDPAQGNAQGTA